MRFSINVFIALAFLIISCNPQYASTSNKGIVNIEYRDNGTVRHMKGENLFDFAGRNSSNISNDSPKELVFSFLDNQKSIFKINKPKIEFEIIDVAIDKIGSKHFLLQQTHNGVPIWGKQIKIHINSESKIYLVSGDYIPTPKSINSDFVISEHNASNKALLAVSENTESWTVEKVEIYYFVLPSGKPHLSYAFTVNHGMLQSLLVFIDARDGQELHRISRIRN